MVPLQPLPPMPPALSIQELTERFAAELAQRSRHQLDRAEAENDRLQADLAREQHRGDELQARLTEAEARLMQLEQELHREREARQCSDHEVAAIHAAIAHQLENAEQEQAALEAAEAERQRQHREHLETLRLQLTQERLRREALQQRVEALRSAAADLFSIDLATGTAASADQALTSPSPWGVAG
jgi:chromosome segregation ATPase